MSGRDRRTLFLMVVLLIAALLFGIFGVMPAMAAPDEAPDVGAPAAAEEQPVPEDAFFDNEGWGKTPIYSAARLNAKTTRMLAIGQYDTERYIWDAPTAAWACVDHDKRASTRCVWVPVWTYVNDEITYYGQVVYTLWLIPDQSGSQ